MKTLSVKKTLKLSLFIGLILAAGQIPINEKVVGARFVTGVKEGTIWCGSMLAQSSLFAGITRPKFLEGWFPVGEKYKAPNLPVEAPKAAEPVKKAEQAKEPIAPESKVDREKIEDSDEDAENIEIRDQQNIQHTFRERMRKTELEPMTASDQAAVLRILE